MKEKKTNGRPTKKTGIDYQKVELLAGFGLTEEEISTFLGITRKTLYNYKKKDDRFLHAIKKGKVEADVRVIQSLFRKAVGGDTMASIYWLNNRRRFQWSQRQQIDLNLIKENVKNLTDEEIKQVLETKDYSLIKLSNE